MVGEVSSKIGKTRRRIGYTTMDGTWIAGVPKTVALGESIGSTMFNITYGGPGHIRMTFTFDIKVYQYALHELGKGGKPAWNSVEKGLAAMKHYLDTNAKLIFPPIKEWMEIGGFE